MSNYTYEAFKAGLIISIAKCMNEEELAITLEQIAERLKKFIDEQDK